MSGVAHRAALGGPLIEASDLELDTPGGRPLIRGLGLGLDREQVALIGRNGAGKSSLLDVLAGRTSPRRGHVIRRTSPVLVPQELTQAEPADAFDLVTAAARRAGLDAGALEVQLAAAGLGRFAPPGRAPGCSLGERRKLHLLAARLAPPELLLLDEPTQDLDIEGSTWLRTWLGDWRGGLVVVSHDRSLLRLFCHFFLIAESGCRCFSGSLTELEAMLDREEKASQDRYVRRLNVLEQQERHSERFRRRRERKKHVGRIRELGRLTPRCRLNQKRSYAQEKQGRIAGIREDRLAGVRAWAKAARRALAVTLPLEVVLPELPPADGSDLVTLEDVAVVVSGRPLLSDLSLHLGRDRLAVVGPNGAGKTTLLRLMRGELEPTRGRARRRQSRIGAIDQGGTDWRVEECVLEHLARVTDATSAEDLARLLIAHRFPLALAERPLASLSPGERLRAALICLLQRRPPPELLILDEPTYALDLAGEAALRAALAAWPGGLVVASHDEDLLEQVGLERRLVLDGQGGHRMQG
jgi:ATPase subunit of ABC transporter with duplicated ATPase domains